ncbi:DUF3768 domain-containing protein [Pseudomonas sp. GX19020]|uniref:DUF3768 domain-containing protein n=1 Tax=Pseudomonas sp. GX19020 TaxID=2942277 RepID=UPI002019ED4B|nr:DUF3768 domain-containing protein [Pseudomonas sp. GX19020]MCL4069497.1 DUF3768 domain-containing protein [Pseudomonas sp. GX19020]
MAQYQCISCETVAVAALACPNACSCCGGPVFDLDRYEATRSEARIIGAQNDAFRKALGPVILDDQNLRGRVLVTRGIREMGPEFVQTALETTRKDENFVDDHCRYGSRSFGMPEIAHDGDTFRIYWKIDLYDNDEVMGPAVESDPSQTIRVLTLCLPEEY